MNWLNKISGGPSGSEQMKIKAAVDILMGEGIRPFRAVDVHDFEQVHVFTDREFTQRQISTTIGNAIPGILGASILDNPRVQIYAHLYPQHEWNRIERFALEKLMIDGNISIDITQDRLGWSKSTSILVLSVFRQERT
jgi:hypothetical protein